MKFYQLRYPCYQIFFFETLLRFQILNRGLNIIHSHLCMNSFSCFLSSLQRGWIYGLSVWVEKGDGKEQGVIINREAGSGSGSFTWQGVTKHRKVPNPNFLFHIFFFNPKTFLTWPWQNSQNIYWITTSLPTPSYPHGTQDVVFRSVVWIFIVTPPWGGGGLRNVLNRSSPQLVY